MPDFEILTQWRMALNSVLTFQAVYYIILGSFLGIIAGAIPGFTSSMAVVILLPMTFYMDSLNALIFLCAIYISCIYGGSLTAILLNTPGTPESSATTFDGYPMTKQGKASEAIGIAIGASVTGGLVSYIFLLLAMNPIARFALKFGPSELFLVAMFGISIIASMRGESLYKGLLAGAFGLLLGTIGIAPTGGWRSTFGNIYLADGIPLVPSIIGFFAMAELLNLVGREYITSKGTLEKRSLRKIFVSMKSIFRYPMTLLRSSIIGIIIGAIPAAGASVAAFTSYNEAKRYSKNSEKFGSGLPEGIIAAETANNASTGGALMTTFVLGIPGSTTTAVIMGAFIMHGLNPGPSLLRTESSLVYALIMSLFLSQVFMVIMSAFAGYSFAGLLVVPTSILVPVITILCALGSFSVRNTIFDMYIVLVFGILGWIMRHYGYPPIATVLGIILGPIADGELIRTYMRFGTDYYLVFFKRPINLVLIFLIILSLLSPFFKKKS